LLEAQSRRHTAHTLRFYRGRLSLFVRWCKDHGIETLPDLTHHHIRQYLIDLDNRGVSSAYLHSHARALRAFCNYCLRDDLLTISPFAKVQMPRLAKKVLPAISAGDIDKILRACQHERDRAIIYVMLDSGVRASELCALTVGDLDLATGAVTVHEGKGQKDRTTYIGAKTRKAVLRYFIKERGGTPPSREPLFMRQEDDGGHMEYDGLKQLMRRLRDASGVKFSAHALRRTFAINSLRNGMNVYVLARLMGHADITVLRAYLEILAEDLQSAAAKFGVVDRL
jgi:integrase/recombinase XerD